MEYLSDERRALITKWKRVFSPLVGKLPYITPVRIIVKSPRPLFLPFPLPLSFPSPRRVAVVQLDPLAQWSMLRGIWQNDVHLLWCYGAMEYMTEQAGAHNEVTLNTFCEIIWKRYWFPLRINCRTISTNIFFSFLSYFFSSFSFFLSSFSFAPPKGARTKVN